MSTKCVKAKQYFYGLGQKDFLKGIPARVGEQKFTGLPEFVFDAYRKGWLSQFYGRLSSPTGIRRV